MRAILSLFYCALFSTLCSQAADWPQWLGPHRNGVTEEENFPEKWPDSGLEILWKKKIGLGFSAASVVGDRVYTMGYEDGEDVLYCFRATTGELLWRSSYPCSVHDKNDVGGPAATPAVEKGRVFTLSRDGEARCFNAATGETLWAQKLHEDLETKMSLFGYTASPLVRDGRAVFDVGSVVAVEVPTGKVLWHTEDYGATYSSPQYLKWDGQQLVCVFNATGLIVLNLTTGEEVGRLPWVTPQYETNTATPVVKDHLVFISSGYDRGCALLRLEPGKAPSIVWEDPDVRTYYNTCVLWNDHLYGFDGDVLKCWNFGTGEVKWSKKWVGKACLVVVSGNLLILSEKGELVLAEVTPEGYREKSRCHLIGGKCWTLPVPSNGHLYLRNAKGDFLCLNMKGST